MKIFCYWVLTKRGTCPYSKFHLWVLKRHDIVTRGVITQNRVSRDLCCFPYWNENKVKDVFCNCCKIPKKIQRSSKSKTCSKTISRWWSQNSKNKSDVQNVREVLWKNRVNHAAFLWRRNQEKRNLLKKHWLTSFLYVPHGFKV